jgi:osmotically inducible lipoprotein OsmB
MRMLSLMTAVLLGLGIAGCTTTEQRIGGAAVGAAVAGPVGAAAGAAVAPAVVD